MQLIEDQDALDKSAMTFLGLSEEGARAVGPRFTDADDLASFIGPCGRFVTKIPGFVPREGQLRLSESCQTAFDAGELLIAEAGTGTGKTFAYLLPALLNENTTVISTASKALQDQLIKKDLPRICDLLHLPHDFFALKGFSNYLCINRFESFKAEYQNHHGLNFTKDPQEDEERELLEKLQRLVVEQRQLMDAGSDLCNYAEINALFSREVTSKLSCDKNTCRGKRCPYRQSCFALRARQKAIHSKVVVVNHALFFADLGIDDNFNPQRPAVLFPKYSQLVFDEAHELPEIGRAHLGQEISLRDMKKLKDDVLNVIEQDKLDIKEEFKRGFHNLTLATDALFAYLKAQGCPAHRNFLAYRYEDFSESNCDPQRSYQKPHEQFRALMRELWRGLHALEKFLDEIKDYDEDVFTTLTEQVSRMRVTVEELMHLDDEKSKHYGNYVGAVEVSKREFSIRITPLEIGGIFGSFLGKCRDHGVGVVMTSATLSVAGKFSKFRRDIGVSENEAQELTVKSCFNYREHAALYVSKEFPEPNRSGREDQIVSSLYEIICANQGGIFVLTTAVASLQAMARSLKQRVGSKRQILVQNGALSNTELLELFRASGDAILVGTSSFWAGVDVPGRALSLVIIDKLPFTAPVDPVFKARCDHYDAQHRQMGRSSFADISIPEAVIELRQGIGRLIRHENDTGGIVICDPRIVTRGYGGLFMKSFPPVRICKDMSELLSVIKSFNEV